MPGQSGNKSRSSSLKFVRNTDNGGAEAFEAPTLSLFGVAVVLVVDFRPEFAAAAAAVFTRGRVRGWTVAMVASRSVGRSVGHDYCLLGNVHVCFGSFGGNRA